MLGTCSGSALQDLAALQEQVQQLASSLKQKEVDAEELHSQLRMAISERDAQIT